MDGIDLDPIARLNRDLAKAATTLGHHEARFLVDAYYLAQENRIRAAHQVRTLGDAEEPHDVIGWYLQQSEALEGQIKRALKRYVESRPVGEWMLSITGVGPVIAAGMMAHIDIRKAPAAGHIHRFAGLDPSVQWHSSKAVDELVDGARKVEETDWAALLWVCSALNIKPINVLKNAGVIAEVPTPEDAWTDLEASEFLVDREQFPGIARLSYDNIIAEQLDIEQAARFYEQTFGEVDWQKIKPAIKRRPWNAQLKRLCWLLGESFTKTSSNENSFYGPIYRERKAQEIAANQQGAFADQAKATLEAKNIGKTTDAYKAYSEGRLPDARIHLRAQRVAVKLFLSHLHEVMYFVEFGQPAPRPYALEHLGHAHYTAPPNMELIPGLAEAIAKREHHVGRS